MAGMPWLRLYTETVDNAKLRVLAFEDRWHFVALLCVKGQGVNFEGENFERFLAVKLGLQMRELDEVKRRLMSAELIDAQWQPLGWDDRQFASDNGAERMRKHREKKKLADGDVTVTSRVRHCSVPDTDTDTELKERITNVIPKKSPKNSAASTRRQTARGTRFDRDVVTREWFDVAEEILPMSKHGESLRIMETFADYWTAQPGQKGVKLDWLATWRNWLRREAEKSAPKQDWRERVYEDARKF